MTINVILTDDALLYVFDFYVAQASDVEAWHTLVHVCRRWRTLVFGSSRRLSLQIAFTNKNSVRELDVWPALPIVITSLREVDVWPALPVVITSVGELDIWPDLPISLSARFISSMDDIDNIQAALRHHNDRVCQIKLYVPRSELAEVFAALEAPFPLLTDLALRSLGAKDAIIPNPVKFMRGSINLRSLSFYDIPVPGIPELLLSSTLVNLHQLHLDNISPIGFFSPEAIVTALSTLTKLKVLVLKIETDEYQSDSDWENRFLPPPTRTVLPSLTVLRLHGDNECLEVFMARVDAPMLDHLNIAFNFFWDMVTGTSQLLWFISRTPNFQAPDTAHIGGEINNYVATVWINFSWLKQISKGVRIDCKNTTETEIPRLAQFCRPPFFPLPTLKYLYIDMGGQAVEDLFLDEVENFQWLEILQPFTAVKNLYLTKKIAPSIAHALQDLAGERPMVLPALENIFIEFQSSGFVNEVIGKFTAERQLSGHPIGIYDWDRTGNT